MIAQPMETLSVAGAQSHLSAEAVWSFLWRRQPLSRRGPNEVLWGKNDPGRPAFSLSTNLGGLTPLERPDLLLDARQVLCSVDPAGSRQR